MPDQSTHIHIRSERHADVAAIANVTAEAFARAEHRSGTEQHIIARLRDAGALTISLVAEAQGRVIGHIAFSPVHISDGSLSWYGLGPVSVAPSHQGRGIGAALILQGLSTMKELGANGCVVLGEPAFYRKFGFVHTPELVLPDVPQEYFLAIAFSDDVPSGNVAYHAAFNAAP